MTTRELAGWGIAGLLAVSLVTCHNAAQQRQGMLRERLRVADSVERVLRRSVRRVDSVYVRDTVRLWRTVTRTQTLIDTLLRSDTVTLTQRESVLVFVADSLVQQCRTTVLACEARVSVRDSLLAVRTQQRDAYRGLIPSRSRIWLDRLLYFSAGYGLAKVMPR